MTIKAVNKFVGRGVISDEFQEKLIGRRMTREDIAAVSPDLDPQDVNAIVLALMSADSFPRFSSEMDLYINRRYGPGPAGDDLPISV